MRLLNYRSTERHRVSEDINIFFSENLQKFKISKSKRCVLRAALGLLHFRLCRADSLAGVLRNLTSDGALALSARAEWDASFMLYARAMESSCAKLQNSKLAGVPVISPRAELGAVLRRS